VPNQREQNDDRYGYTQKPQQDTASHDFLLHIPGLSPSNRVQSELVELLDVQLDEISYSEG
jgi:hypothetical protein